MADKEQRRIEIPVLTRVEGEGALELSKFLEGRAYSEVLDVVARICGICPVAYQMSAVHAIEQIFNIDAGPWVKQMRRLMYCGEWIQSHALHIHLLAAPDFLGFENTIAMAEHYPDEVRRGLQVQQLGNRLISLLGGRSVHPVGACVGGFFRAPSVSEVNSLLADCRQALPMIEAMVKWTATLDLPEDEQAFTSVALRHADEYPMNGGRLVSSDGLDIGIDSYHDHFTEVHVPHSTALHSSLGGRPYLVGPLARLNLNQDKLPPQVRQILTATGISFPSQNMFHSIIARAIEIYFALLEAIRILEAYQFPDTSHFDVSPKAGVGFGCTEAPRGILWHRYELDRRGGVLNVDIVPPTSQNQARMEEDLRTSLQSFGLQHDDAALRERGEMIIRNYDPCISCSTHFLKIKVLRQ